MGATSVTGVSGSGSVQDAIYPGGYGQQKGSEHMSLGIKHLVGPRVVCAGSVALVGGTATINLPDLVDPTAVYFAMAQDATTAANTVHAVLTYPGNPTPTSLPQMVLTGTGTDTINWLVVKGLN